MKGGKSPNLFVDLESEGGACDQLDGRFQDLLDGHRVVRVNVWNLRLWVIFASDNVEDFHAICLPLRPNEKEIMMRRVGWKGKAAAPYPYSMSSSAVKTIVGSVVIAATIT